MEEIVAQVPRRRDAEHLVLVLTARGIACRIAFTGGAWVVLVAAEQAARAGAELAAYARENAVPPPRPAPARPLGTASAWAFMLLLLFCHGVQRRDLFGLDWTELGAAQAGAIRDGAWWRAVTALTLHADAGHLLGNLAAGFVFGSLLAQQVGPGIAWLAILLTGVLGNLANAWLRGPEHAAIGASTALFGALGLLSGYLRHGWRMPWRGGIRRWAPLSAGILLLVQLGTSGERTDVGAHLLGFAVGVGGGLALAAAGPHLPRGPRAQLLCGALALALLALAWALALG